MSQLTLVMTWDDTKTVSMAVVCHCGRRFAMTLEQLEEAHAHVRSHIPIPGTEPT